MPASVWTVGADLVSAGAPRRDGRQEKARGRERRGQVRSIVHGEGDQSEVVVIRPASSIGPVDIAARAGRPRRPVTATSISLCAPRRKCKRYPSASRRHRGSSWVRIPSSRTITAKNVAPLIHKCVLDPLRDQPCRAPRPLASKAIGRWRTGLSLNRFEARSRTMLNCVR